MSPVFRGGWLPAVVLAAALCSLSASPVARAQADSTGPRMKGWPDSLQTFEQYVRAHLREMTPPDLRAQQQKRRRFQQRGYGEVSVDLLRQDGLGALVSYLRCTLWVAYSMPHRIFWIIPPQEAMGSVIPGIPFPDDWSFPPDPWSKD
jgi:hypothetical protein